MHRITARLAPLVLACALPAQEVDLAQASERLQEALARTRALDAVAFQSIESTDEALLRGLPIPPKDDVQVNGRRAGDLLLASIGYDEDEVLLAGGRMLARQGGGAWKLRRNCLADGRPLPFVADPLQMVGLLADLPAKDRAVVHAEPGKVRDADVTVYTITLAGAAADELLFAGFMPRTAGPRAMVALGGATDLLPKPQVTLDIAISVDAATGHVVRLQSRAYVKSTLPGNVRIQVQGGGEFDEADEEEEAEDENEDAAGA